MIRSEPMLHVALVIVRRKLLEAFPDENQLPMWRSKRWHHNPLALLHDIERLQQGSLPSAQSALIQQASNLLVLSDGSNKQLSNVTHVGRLLRLANSGLKFKTSGQKRSEDNKPELERGNRALRERAAALATNSHLSVSAIAKILVNREERAKSKKRGLYRQLSVQTIRKIIAETVKSKRRSSRKSG